MPNMAPMRATVITEYLLLGQSFEDFLTECDILEEVNDRAIKAIFTRQLQAEMKRKRLSKRKVAEQIGTSRSQLDRILDPHYDNVTLGALRRAAEVVGLQVKLELIPAVQGHPGAAVSGGA